MKINYDKEVDAIYLKLTDKKICKTEDISEGILVDYDAENSVVGIEILFFVKKYKNDLNEIFKQIDFLITEK